MPYLPTRMPKLVLFAASAAIGLFVFAGADEAKATLAPALSGVAEATSPVEPIGYYRRYRRSYVPDYAVKDYAPNYRTYSYRHYGNGHDEIRELQRLFPETNWPASMRYHQY